MFYCDEDAKRYGWPQTLFHSYGRCEVCGQSAICNDYPSSMLPDPEPIIEEDKVKINRTETIQSESVYAPDVSTALNKFLYFCRELAHSGYNLDDLTIGWEFSSDSNWISFVAVRSK